MLSRQVLLRLSELNRTSVPDNAERTVCTSLPAFPTAAGSTSDLPAGHEATSEFGAYWHIEHSVALLWPDYERHLAIYRKRLAASQPDAPRHAELDAVARFLPHATIFLDLETCGLAGAMIFLIGLIHERDGQCVLTQLLARDYSEEKAVLGTLWRLMAGRQVLVTFNGKSFDWPLTHDRSTLHHLGFDARLPRGIAHSVARIEDAKAVQCESNATALVRDKDDPRPDPLHCDLLHHARRRWRGRLPNCKLQTLERHLCGRYRSGDIPGHAIPAAYHEFVRSGDAWQLRSILHHNALDLVTLLQLSMRFACDAS